MKLLITNFWDGGFEGDFFEFFFNKAFNGFERTNSAKEADLIVTSLFGYIPTEFAEKTICYIGENVRPSYVGYKYSLSFDYDTYGGRNFRLPLWWSRLAWDGFKQKPRKPNAHNHGYEDLISIASLTNGRTLDLSQKTKFCAMIAGNPEGLRVNLYNSLHKYKPVDGYGLMFGNSLRQSKFDILPEYKFSLCPENSVYDGYVTEKLVDAYAGGTVPIYSGDLSVDRDFNNGAFLNYQFELSTYELRRQVIKLDESLDLYQEIYEQPLLVEEPYLDDAIQFVRSIT
jgi:hypothetical protein